VLAGSDALDAPRICVIASPELVRGAMSSRDIARGQVSDAGPLVHRNDLSESPDLRAKLTDLGLEAIGNSPAEFAVAVKSQIPPRAKQISESKIKPD